MVVKMRGRKVVKEGSMNIKMLMFSFLILSISVISEEINISGEESDSAGVTAENEIQELEELKKEIEALKRESDELNKQKETLYVKDDVKEKDNVFGEFDTLKLKTKESAKAFLQSFSGAKRNTRERGYGGAMGPAFAVQAINVEDAVAFLERDNSLGSYAISGDYETFLLSGGVIYGGIGNGIRVGGAGWGGSRSFISNEDSDKSVSLGLGFGGFLLEKCFVKKNVNIMVGGILGAGGFTLKPREITDSFFDKDTDYVEATVAFMLVELHSGITYSMKSWMHFGLDFTAPFFISPSGYEINDISVTNGFATINPGLRIKLVFGNLG